MHWQVLGRAWVCTLEGNWLISPFLSYVCVHSMVTGLSSFHLLLLSTCCVYFWGRKELYIFIHELTVVTA